MSRKTTDAALAKVRTICETFPQFAEVEAWGHPTFRSGKKMFAAFGELDGAPTLGLNVGLDRQKEMLEDARFFPTPYAAHRGWVSMRLDSKSDWELIAQLLRESFKRVATKRIIASLDEQ